ncbi:MAG: UDP-N-acetylglucosamine 2-epimerase, partial [Oscillospiraceae bacterium]
KDEWFRHSISKMASLHFPSCAPYAQRLINMGEEPQRIFTVGGLGDENIRFLKLHDIKVLSRLLKFDFEKSFSLVTYHPQTLGGTSPRAEMQSLLNAIEKYPRENFVITKSNADAGGSEINNMIDDFVATHENAVCFASMGVVNYLSAMKFAHAVIGNSSSGVVETPSFAVPCVNIGDRQKGRIISDNVICCSTDEDEIFRALKLAFSKEFAVFARKTVSPYDGGRTSEKIVDNIVKYFESDLSKKNKTFHDLKGVVLDTN